MDPKDIRIKPRCLTFQPKSYHKPAAYTADGFMLPCCWLDDPKNDHALENEFHMKDEHLALKNVDKVEDIYSSKEWACLLYTSPSPRDRTRSRMPSSA